MIGADQSAAITQQFVPPATGISSNLHDAYCIRQFELAASVKESHPGVLLCLSYCLRQDGSFDVLLPKSQTLNTRSLPCLADQRFLFDVKKHDVPMYFVAQATSYGRCEYLAPTNNQASSI